MYKYNIIIKRGRLDEPDARAMLHDQLTRRFGMGDNWTYITRAILDNEVVAIVMAESKRGLQTTLDQWFAEHIGINTFPVGTLLHYRQITADEPITNQLGG